MPVGTTGVLHCRFYKRDLIPVKHIIYAANREEIRVEGAIFLRLTGKRATGFLRRIAAVLVYISPSTNRFYLSREALIQLDVILPDFPRVGAATETSSITVTQYASCGCPARTQPPPRPVRLPFICTPENNGKMDS